MYPMAEQLGQLLLMRGESIATAESCTGGLVAAAITSVPGSSAWFGTGYVTYSNDAKEKLLGVDAQTLANHGAVSEPTVRKMAMGAKEYSGADWVVAVSGIAGPDGGTLDKPVGTVWFGYCGPNGKTWAERVQFEGDRASVRAQSVEVALQTVLAACQKATLSA